MGKCPRGMVDFSGEVHDGKQLAQQASACCLPLPPTAFCLGGATKFWRNLDLFPRRSDQVLQTDNFKRSGVTGASLTSGTHVLPLAGRLAFFGPVRSRPPGGPPDYFRGGRGATYITLPLSGFRAMMPDCCGLSDRELCWSGASLPAPEPHPPGLLAPGPYPLGAPDVL